MKKINLFIYFKSKLKKSQNSKFKLNDGKKSIENVEIFIYSRKY